MQELEMLLRPGFSWTSKDSTHRSTLVHAFFAHLQNCYELLDFVANPTSSCNFKQLELWP